MRVPLLQRLIPLPRSEADLVFNGTDQPVVFSFNPTKNNAISFTSSCHPSQCTGHHRRGGRTGILGRSSDSIVPSFASIGKVSIPPTTRIRTPPSFEPTTTTTRRRRTCSGDSGSSSSLENWLDDPGCCGCGDHCLAVDRSCRRHRGRQFCQWGRHSIQRLLSGTRRGLPRAGRRKCLDSIAPSEECGQSRQKRTGAYGIVLPSVPLHGMFHAIPADILESLLLLYTPVIGSVECLLSQELPRLFRHYVQSHDPKTRRIVHASDRQRSRSVAAGRKSQIRPTHHQRRNHDGFDAKTHSRTHFRRMKQKKSNFLKKNANSPLEIINYKL